MPDMRVLSGANDRPEVIRSAFKAPPGSVVLGIGQHFGDGMRQAERGVWGFWSGCGCGCGRGGHGEGDETLVHASEG